MRRKDRERNSVFAFEVFKDCEYATLATINTDGTPHCIPISPVVIDNAIYFHCASEGQKSDNIRENNNICISGVSYTNLVPEKFTTEYKSAVAVGKCEIISDEAEKLVALQAICEKYAKNNINNFDEQIKKSLNNTCICRIDIDKITGKANLI